jgi:hypothetical protein
MRGRPRGLGQVCGLCRRAGHNSRTCPDRPLADAPRPVVADAPAAVPCPAGEPGAPTPLPTGAAELAAAALVRAAALRADLLALAEAVPDHDRWVAFSQAERAVRYAERVLRSA